MVLKTLFLILFLAVGCSDERKVEVTPEVPTSVAVDDVASGSSLMDFEQKLSPELVGAADEYIFSMSWRMPPERTEELVVWRTDGNKISPEILFHSLEPDHIFKTQEYVLKAGAVHEFYIRVFNDEAKELLFQATFEAYEKALKTGELLRTIRIDLK